MNDKSKYDLLLSKLNDLSKLYTRSTDLRKEIFKMKNHNCMIDDTIEQMRQEMTSIDKKIEMIEAEIKVIKSDPSNYYHSIKLYYKLRRNFIKCSSINVCICFRLIF